MNNAHTTDLFILFWYCCMTSLKPVIQMVNIDELNGIIAVNITAMPRNVWADTLN